MSTTWPDSAVKLIESARVMTIATYSSVKGSWSAPVYYVCRKKIFYFFSNSKSRHIEDTGIQNGKAKKKLKVSASIFFDSCCFKKIKGIQMTGTIEQVLIQKHALAAAGNYIKKFGINVDKQDPLRFIVRHFHASFYKFIPESVFFMDNNLKLGLREELKPDWSNNR